jgi:probable DNA metabolism protein
MELTDELTPRRGQPLAIATFAEWREAARELLASSVPPEAVAWSAPGGVLSSGAPQRAPPAHNAAMPLTEPQPAPHLPRSLMDMLQAAGCCRVSDRWAFLYRLVWRWQQGEHDVQSAADADGARLHAMVKAVHREEHDMHANLRFRERPEGSGPPRFVAWFEPAHDVLPQVAQHFVSRMGKVSWMIATPEACVLWDGATLHNCGPLMDSAAGLDDAGQASWLAYYRSIFHPARVDAPLLFAGKRGATIPIAAAAEQPGPDQPSSLDQCRRCDLWQHATQAVGGEGPRRARIMLVGEQPGDQEDLAGKPFVGPAGKLLDRACAQAGVDRRTLYLTNAVKHFKWEPRGKRRLHKTPAQREIDACSYWLDKELAAVQPDVIVALGTTALKALLGTSHVTLKDTLGQPIRHQGRWVVTIYHPSYVLRVPDKAAKEQAFAVMVEGLKLARTLLDQPPHGA